MINIINERRSIRSFSNKKIEDEKILTLYQAIQQAPSWKNKQCFEVIHINDKKLQSEIGELCKFNPSKSAYEDASDLFIFIADPNKSGNRDQKPYYLCDSANAITHCILCATSLGIGSCWVGIFPELELKQKLQIPDHYRIVALLPLGYPNEHPDARSRRNIDDIIHINHF